MTSALHKPRMTRAGAFLIGTIDGDAVLAYQITLLEIQNLA